MRYAIRNLIRLKGRSFLTFTIAFLILFLSMFGILIVRLCEDSRAGFWGPLDGSLHITDDEFSPFFTYQMAKAIEEHSDIITDLSAVKECTIHLLGVDHIGKGEHLRSWYNSEKSYIEFETNTPQFEKVDYYKSFTLCAVTDMSFLEEVYSGELIMTEGTMISEENNEVHANKLVISKTIAEKNGLSLGDTVYFDGLSAFVSEADALWIYNLYGENFGEVSYIIGGIYEHKVDNSISAATPDLIHENKLYIPISTLVDMEDNPIVDHYYQENHTKRVMKYSDIVPDHLYFHMDDIGDAASLEKELNRLGLAKTVKLTPYMSDATSSPSARLAEIMTTLLIGVVVFGFVILVLAVLFHMKARHRELAVLSALGQKRGAIIPVLIRQ